MIFQNKDCCCCRCCRDNQQQGNIISYFKYNMILNLIINLSFCIYLHKTIKAYYDNLFLKMTIISYFTALIPETIDEARTFNSSYEIFQDYTEYATIQGLIYIFFSYQSIFGKIFWSLTILLMVMLGLYWCTMAYLDWEQQPVLTTVTTTAFPVKLVSY